MPRAKTKWRKELVAELIAQELGPGIRWSPFPRKWLVRTDGVWAIDSSGSEIHRRIRSTLVYLEEWLELEPSDMAGVKYLRSLRNWGPLQSLLTCIKQQPEIRLERLSAKDSGPNEPGWAWPIAKSANGTRTAYCLQ